MQWLARKDSGERGTLAGLGVLRQMDATDEGTLGVETAEQLAVLP